MAHMPIPRAGDNVVVKGPHPGEQQTIDMAAFAPPS